MGATRIEVPDELAGPIPVQTYGQLAYREIRHRILDGRLAPGEKLTVRVLSELLGFSPTPIKNALSALENEGFLENLPHRGFSVPVISRTTLGEAFEVLEALDALASTKIARSAERAQAVRRLQSLTSQEAESHASGEGAGFEMDFHRLIWALANNEQLAHTAERQRGIVLVASGGLIEEPDLRSVVRDEHNDIIRAIEDGDPDRVRAACAHHMRETSLRTAARLDEIDSGRR